jgi:hypothetical protein
VTLIGSGSPGQVAYWVDDEELGGSDDHFWDSTNNRLGVGTTTPDCLLHVVKSGSQITVSVYDVAVFQNSVESGYNAYVRIISGDEGKAVIQLGNETEPEKQSIACDNVNDEMEITAGKVGIGTTGPHEKLEVNGKIRANTAFNVNGTDGITQTINILDKNNVRHTLVLTGGILTSYSTS